MCQEHQKSSWLTNFGLHPAKELLWWCQQEKSFLGLVHNCSGCHGMSTKCLTKTFSFRRFIRQSVMRSLWIYWIKNVKQEKSWDANHLLNGFMMNHKFNINVVILFCITISTYIFSYIRFMEMGLWFTNYISSVTIHVCLCECCFLSCL